MVVVTLADMVELLAVTVTESVLHTCAGVLEKNLLHVSFDLSPNLIQSHCSKLWIKFFTNPGPGVIPGNLC